MLVSRDWLEKHRHDLDNWHPTIELSRPGSKQTIVIRDKNAEKEVIKILKEK